MKVVYDQMFLEHRGDGHHPESPARLDAITSTLLKSGLEDFISPPPATLDQILRAHGTNYVSYLKSVKGGIDLDTYVNENSFEIAVLAAGGALEAVRLARDGEDVLALLRPPGHHAGRGFGGGFCLLNNAAIAACGELDQKKRVVILDIDGHHGNGTQDIFYGEKNVLYMSAHHWGIFPGSGRYDESGTGEAEGTNVNVPLPDGSGDATYKMTIERVWLPILEQFKPDTVLLCIGMDCHYMDPLTGLSLSSPAFMDILQ
ncbi:MAG TPA: histone deacetylase, partial [Euryarchaeota archaeon]|nr:histone deacetylase [Euryarchaeota archaeon]